MTGISKIVTIMLVLWACPVMAQQNCPEVGQQTGGIKKAVWDLPQNQDIAKALVFFRKDGESYDLTKPVLEVDATQNEYSFTQVVPVSNGQWHTVVYFFNAEGNHGNPSDELCFTYNVPGPPINYRFIFEFTSPGSQ